MPLVRYEVRCEHSLANPELYRTMPEDDSEVLLEGVAFAGLVGIIRQIGDLADFAAEVFLDLHDDVMTIFTQSENIKSRVTRLEADLPAIEKALRAEATQFRFAYTTRSEWRASLPMDQNQCSQGKPPRFILNFYDDCLGPPRLDLLDKFEPAGPGTCVKKYSDPTFFRLAWATSLEKAQQEWRLEQENKRSSFNDQDLRNNSLHLPSRERSSSGDQGHYEGLAGLSSRLTSRLRSKRLDQVPEVPLSSDRTPEEGQTPDRSFGTTEVAEGPKPPLLKISAKDIEKAILEPRIQNPDDVDYDKKGVPSVDHSLDTPAIVGHNAKDKIDSQSHEEPLAHRLIEDGREVPLDQEASMVSLQMNPHREVHVKLVEDGSSSMGLTMPIAVRMEPSCSEQGEPLHTEKTTGEYMSPKDVEAPTEDSHPIGVGIGHEDLNLHIEATVESTKNLHSKTLPQENGTEPATIAQESPRQIDDTGPRDCQNVSPSAKVEHGCTTARNGSSQSTTGEVVGADTQEVAMGPIIETTSVKAIDSQWRDIGVINSHELEEMEESPRLSADDVGGGTSLWWNASSSDTQMSSPVSGDKDFLSSASSTPMSSTFCALLSPPESPPLRTSLGLKDSPVGLYNSSLQSDQSTPSPPSIPILSSSLTILRHQLRSPSHFSHAKSPPRRPPPPLPPVPADPSHLHSPPPRSPNLHKATSETVDGARNEHDSTPVFDPQNLAHASEEYPTH